LSTIAAWPLAPWTVAAQTMAAWGALGLAMLGGAPVTSTGRR
jgi:hypothetical protein